MSHHRHLPALSMLEDKSSSLMTHSAALTHPLKTMSSIVSAESGASFGS